jgi:hypothetical protein
VDPTPIDELEFQGAMQRFFVLPAAEQLRAFQAMRDYLADTIVATEADRELDERAQSLEVIAEVARELDLPEGQAPTTTQFNEVSKRLGLGWSVSRVGRAWGKWRFAAEAFTGHRTRTTARQRALRSAHSGKRRTHEDYLTALRLWLDTKPAVTTTGIYDAWAREYSDSPPPGRRPVPLWMAIYKMLGVSFENALRAARGDGDLSEMSKTLRTRNDHGPLVSTRWIAEERGLLPHQARQLTHRPDFPRPVVKLSTHRAWLRDDVEAFFAARDFPKRRDYELEGEYLSAREAASLLGCPVWRISNGSPGLPKPVGQVSSRQYWRKRDIERCLARNNGSPRSSDRRKR